mmetsp:Transcript_61015/g.145394  ORF Transcript_61015/g.145394 Transcript_61015/m.145394 type:complete len:154 (+) Transcript_61015:59-520(+)
MAFTGRSMAPNTASESSASDSPMSMMSSQGTSSETTLSEAHLMLRQHVEAASRRAKMQRRAFHYASRQEMHAFTQDLIGHQQGEVFKAHAAIRKLNALEMVQQQAGEVHELKSTQQQIKDTRAQQNRCDAHFTRLQRAKKRGHSPGRCLLFSY